MYIPSRLTYSWMGKIPCQRTVFWSPSGLYQRFAWFPGPLHLQVENLHGEYTSHTKIAVFCEKINFFVTLKILYWKQCILTTVRINFFIKPKHFVGLRALEILTLCEEGRSKHCILTKYVAHPWTYSPCDSE